MKFFIFFFFTFIILAAQARELQKRNLVVNQLRDAQAPVEGLNVEKPVVPPLGQSLQPIENNQLLPVQVQPDLNVPVEPSSVLLPPLEYTPFPPLQPLIPAKREEIPIVPLVADQPKDKIPSPLEFFMIRPPPSLGGPNVVPINAEEVQRLSLDRPLTFWEIISLGEIKRVLPMLPENERILDPYRPVNRILDPYVLRQNERILDPYMIRQGERILDPYVMRQSERILDPYVLRQNERILDPYFLRQNERILDPYVLRQSERILDPYRPALAQRILDPYIPLNERILDPYRPQPVDNKRILDPYILQGDRILDPLYIRRSERILDPYRPMDSNRNIPEEI